MTLEIPDPCALLGGSPDQFGPIYLPYVVVLHVPEWIVGADHGSVRAEQQQKASEFPVDEFVGRESWLASDAPADGPQGEQWLVRSALASVPPDVQLLELLKEMGGQDSVLR